ncbi:UNVERIFIED_CONTAM: Membrane protein of ER body-like protein [Sesamum latifolium]|uniref:Membrane protein of ER body-like protein n=1 Tax=Sesamum latifolium TaxID=2727402 RepID=A0AAW2T6W2_9LAMI
MKQFDAYTKDQLTESKPEKEVHVNRETDLSGTALPLSTHVTNGESAEDAISFSQQGGLKLLISSNKESLTLENSERRSNWTMQSGAAEASTDKEAIQLSPKSVSVLKASDVDGNLNISVSIPNEEQDITATILTESVVENKNANFRSSNNGQAYPTGVTQHIITKTKVEVHSGESLGVDNISGALVAQGKDAVITIDAQPAGSSQTLQGIIRPTETATILQSASQISTADRERTEVRKEFEIEVIKSIVYGGLAESITSLSVSSAAGGGAATLNILALGVANLIGGLFIICHNLWELKSDRVEQVANQVSDEATKQRDRYKELLGRRQNFILHAVVAIISYLVFGLVPPVVYGFSFRKTDDKQLKLVRPPKPYLKSIITFVTLGVMVSGVSYAAGELVERLLEKLGLFQSSSVPNLLVPDMEPTGSGWAAYYE